MQRKGNAIRSESQVKNQISVGIDMGGSLWAKKCREKVMPFAVKVKSRTR